MTVRKKKTTQEFHVSGGQLLEKVKKLIREGNIRHITIKDKKGKTIVELPVTLGVVGIAVVPLFVAVGVLAALLTECSIVVEREV